MNVRRLVKYSLIGFATLATAALIAVAFVIPSIDAERYRPFIEKKARALTGRDLHIGGPLRLRVTLRLAIVASDVHLSNVAWGTYSDLVSVDRVDAEVGVFALLRGVVRIERLSLYGPRVFLEMDAAGNGNWMLKPERRSDTALPWKIEVALDECSLADARIEYRDRTTKRRYAVSLTQVVADRRGASAFVLIGGGVVEGKPLSLRAVVGATGGIFEPRSRFELTLEGTLAAMAIAASGTIDDLITLGKLDLQLSAKGDELAAVADDFGWKTPAIGPYEAVGRLTRSRRQFRLQGIRFSAGRKETVLISGTGEVGDVMRRSGVAFNVDVGIDRVAHWAAWLGKAADWLPAMRVSGRITQHRRGFDVERLVFTLGRMSLSGGVRLDLAAAQPKISGKLRATAIDLTNLPARGSVSSGISLARVLDSPDPLNVDWMQKFDADLDLVADVIRLPRGQTLYRPSTRVRLREGELALAPVRLQLAPQSPPISARLIVQHRPLSLQATMAIAGASLPLHDLLTLVGSTTAIEGAPTQIDIDLRSIGRSPRELIGALNGDAKLIVGRGKFPSNKVDFGASLLTQLLGIGQPKEQRRADLICAAVHLPIRSGVATSDRNLALHTSNVTIVASGVVDVRSEAMDVYVYTRATEGLGLEAGKLTNMLKIQGAIAAPTIGVNPKGVVQGGLSIGAAVATGGVSLLFEGLARKAAADRDPCGTALKLPSAR